VKDALIGAAAALSAFAALLAAFYSKDRRAKGRGRWYEFRLVVVPAIAAVGLNIATILRPPSSGMHALEKDTLLSAAAAMSASAALLAAFYSEDRRAKGRGRWYQFGLVVVPALAAVGLNIAAILVPRLT
jgi:hypothetical protein